MDGEVYEWGTQTRRALRQILDNHLHHLTYPKYLEYGCGRGGFARFIATKHRAIVVAYDPDTDVIAKENTIMHENGFAYLEDVLFFTSELRNIQDFMFQPPYDTASLQFVLHESSQPFIDLSIIHRDLEKGGLLVVADYHMKGISEERFLTLFCTDEEQNELERLGKAKAYEIHTAYGLDDMVADAEHVGFKTRSVKTIGDKFYVWSGEKQTNNT